MARPMAICDYCGQRLPLELLTIRLGWLICKGGSCQKPGAVGEDRHAS